MGCNNCVANSWSAQKPMQKNIDWRNMLGERSLNCDNASEDLTLLHSSLGLIITRLQKLTGTVSLSGGMRLKGVPVTLTVGHARPPYFLGHNSVLSEQSEALNFTVLGLFELRLPIFNQLLCVVIIYCIPNTN